MFPIPGRISENWVGSTFYMKLHVAQPSFIYNAMNLMVTDGKWDRICHQTQSLEKFNQSNITAFPFTVNHPVSETHLNQKGCITRS
jgi:hypothetical protein